MGVIETNVQGTNRIIPSIKIENFISIEECDFIKKFININNQISQIEINSIETISKNRDIIINSTRINDIRNINKAFEMFNAKIFNKGILIGYFESNDQRKKYIFEKYIWFLNYCYYILDFIFNRFLPKFSLTKKIYFKITKGRNRALSTAEVFGRLYSCGFKHIEHKEINNKTFFVFQKIKEPSFDMNPTYGPLITLNRIGHKGKRIKVYKFRTMHPYSEYLQAYVYKINSLQSGGKFANDFRVTTLGRFMRKFWIDELPMIINFFKGELKLVGVRPISLQYYTLYDNETQKLRIKVKPGLIPPYYADMPKTLEEIQQSEVKYTLAYLKNPLKTDLYYLYKIFINIILKRKRSA